MKIYLKDMWSPELRLNGKTVFYATSSEGEVKGTIFSILKQSDMLPTDRENYKRPNDLWGARVTLDSGLIVTMPANRLYYYTQTDVELIDETERLKNNIEVLRKDNKQYAQKVLELTETITRQENFIKYQNEQNEKLAAAIRKYTEETTDWLYNLEQML